MTTILWIFGSVVGLVVLYLLVMFIVTVVRMMLGSAPKGVTAEVVHPSGVVRDEDFLIEIHIREALGQERRLRSVDFDSTYLEGIAVRSIEPRPTTSPSAPTLGTCAYKMNEPIPANSTTVVRVACRGVKHGDFVGEVTIYVDSGSFRWISLPLRTVVRAPGG